MIDVSHEADVQRYEESLDVDQSIVTMLHMYSEKSKTTKN